MISDSKNKGQNAFLAFVYLCSHFPVQFCKNETAYGVVHWMCSYCCLSLCGEGKGLKGICVKQIYNVGKVLVTLRNGQPHCQNLKSQMLV